MHTERVQKQKFVNFFGQGPKRSLSYNDLKKKRLIRSEKSKSKLKGEDSEKFVVRTQKKKPSQNFSIGISYSAYDCKKIQKSICELKEVFVQMKQKAQSKKYVISKPFYTDRNYGTKKRPILQPFISLNDNKNSFYTHFQMAGNQKQLIKQIISKKKSHKCLLKFDQIRDELKRSKSKSKSKSKPKLIINSQLVVGRDKTTVSPSLIQHARSIKNIHVNKFQTVKQPSTTNNDIHKSCNTQAVNRYQTVQSQHKQNIELKSQHQSRRKLRINDFKTQRRTQTNENFNASSEAKLKFHRKLRKSNSEIVIKNKQVIYNKNKYASKFGNKSVFNINSQKPEQQRKVGNINTQRSSLRLNQKSKTQRLTINKAFRLTNGKTQHPLTTTKPPITTTNQRLQDQFRNLNNLRLQAMNISQIEMKKEQSLLDIQNQIDIVQMIQEQQLEIQMKRTYSVPPVGDFRKELQTKFKFRNKEGDCSQMENAENIQNLSNILDFVCLPTKQLKVKINKCSKANKKKNQLEKFKKIFPVNFFNN